LIEEPSQRFSYEALSKSVKRSNSNNAGSSHSSINSTILTKKGKSKKAKQITNPVREESFVTIPNKKVPKNINQTFTRILNAPSELVNEQPVVKKKRVSTSVTRGSTKMS
jgi:hypothetical protein